MDHPTIFDILTTVFAKAGTVPILIGGFAVNAYHVTRQTIDIDFMILEDPYRRVCDLLLEEGFSEAVKEKNFSRFKPGVHAGLLFVDFLFIDTGTYAAIQREGKTVRLAGRDFMIPSLDHLISMKLHAIKQQPSLRELKDLSDIVELVRMNQIDARSGHFRGLCEKFGTLDIYEKILRYTGQEKL